MSPDDTVPGPSLVARAARAGASHRRRFGTPPPDPGDMAAWLQRTYRIHVDYFRLATARIAGAWRALPGRDDVAGMILLARRLPHPRWTLAHEWGHFATGSTAGYSLLADGRYRANLPEERAANAAAVAWLIPGDELVELVLRDARRQDIAARYGVPDHAVMLRRLLMADLGELAPLLDAAEHGLLPADDWDPA